MIIKGILGILLLVMVATLPQVAADATNSIYPPNTQQTLFAQCLTDGQFTNTLANISIYYPNTTVLLENQSMTAYQDGKFNFTFRTDNITGDYSVCVLCGTGVNNCGSFQIKNFEEETGMALVGIILGMALFLGFLTFVFLKLDDEHIIMKFLILMFMLFFTILIPRAVLESASLQSGAALMFFLSVTWFMRVAVGYIMIYTIYKIFSSVHLFTRIISGFSKK